MRRLCIPSQRDGCSAALSALLLPKDVLKSRLVTHLHQRRPCPYLAVRIVAAADAPGADERDAAACERVHL